MPNGNLNTELSKKYGGLKLWVLVGLCVGAFVVFILGIMSIWVLFRRKSKRALRGLPPSQIPNISKEIRVDRIVDQGAQDPESVFLSINDKSGDKNSEKMLGRNRSNELDNMSQCSSVFHHEKAYSSHSGEEGSSGNHQKQSSMSYGLAMPSPLVGLPEGSHLGWGHWFTLRDLQIATNRFSSEYVIGEGGYGVVYRGRLVNGSDVAVKKLLNNL